MERNDFIKGALVGGVVSGLFALFLAPKSGKDLRNNIIETYDSLNEQGHDYVDSIKEKACEMQSRAHEFVDNLRGVEPQENHAFLMGGLSGAVIGALAGLLLAPQAGSKLREKLGDQYCDIYDKAKDTYEQMQKKGHEFEGNLDEWKDVCAKIIDKLSTSSSRKATNNSYLNEIFDWASLGLRLYNQSQARR